MANRNVIHTRAPAKSNGRLRSRINATAGHNVNSRIVIRTRKNARIKVV